MSKAIPEFDAARRHYLREMDDAFATLKVSLKNPNSTLEYKVGIGRQCHRISDSVSAIADLFSMEAKIASLPIEP